MPERDHTDLRDASEKLLRALEEPRAAIKQVLVYRRDLNMRKGKIAAQVAHAAMKVFFDRGRVMFAYAEKNFLRVQEFEDSDEEPGECVFVIRLTPEMRRWVEGLFTKIVLTVDSEEDLLRARDLAEAAGIPTAQITDAGRTEFKTECSRCRGTGMISGGRHDTLNDYQCPECWGTGRVNVPTNTAIAIGPDTVSAIDEITGPEGMVPTRLP